MSGRITRLRIHVALAVVVAVVFAWAGHAVTTGHHAELSGAVCGVALCLGVATGALLGARLRLAQPPLVPTGRATPRPVALATAIATAVIPRAASPPPLRL